MAMHMAQGAPRSLALHSNLARSTRVHFCIIRRHHPRDSSAQCLLRVRIYVVLRFAWEHASFAAERAGHHHAVVSGNRDGFCFLTKTLDWL